MQHFASSSSLQFCAYPNSFLPADPDFFHLSKIHSFRPIAFDRKVAGGASRGTISDL